MSDISNGEDGDLSNEGLHTSPFQAGRPRGVAARGRRARRSPFPETFLGPGGTQLLHLRVNALAVG